MTIFRVRIKVAGALTLDKRNGLRAILQEREVRVLRIIDVDDTYIALLENELSCQKMFQPATIADLAAKQFIPIMPIEMKARLTLVMKNMDRQVMEESIENLKQELEETHEGLRVDDIYKLTKSNMIKVRLATHEMTTKIKNEGTRLLNFSIAPWQVEYENFTKIKQCVTCQSYDHVKKQCPTPNLIFCSECGSNDHTWKQCKPENPKLCANCKGNHRSMSNSCDIRKGVIKKTQEENRRAEKEKSNRPMQ